MLAAYASGEIRVTVTVAVLTEGWDHPHLLCRAAAPQFLQVDHDPDGRAGLAHGGPEQYPGIVKTDRIVLDFGTSSLIHGTLEQDVDLDRKTETGEAPHQSLPSIQS